ncbi:HpcH/HpaI aldolase family protein [Halioxenophilus sp. WMMB6]|uniref:HpcH/HpaI aldolase family protein n=1 Tax=Halioxenophilus sp. WMMB6 TaxID=3073815 RepID=UPI00295EDA0A|nr:aldolase/citrate lyase family protein [Halioxenophilus sp. WMMB6]
MDSLIDRYRGGARLFATWLSIGSTYTAETLSGCGYDCLVLDTQHGAITWDQLGAVIQAVDLNKVPSLVRVGWIDHIQIMRALDLGAAGVIVPMVSTAEEARRAVAACRYPPGGVRSFGRVRNYYGKDQRQHEPLCLVMIETEEGLRNVADIAAIEGVDGLFIGPVDLGLALGLGVVLDENKTLFSAISTVVQACQENAKICASASFSGSYSKALLQLGVNFIVQGSDVGFIRTGATEMVRHFREL